VTALPRLAAADDAATAAAAARSIVLRLEEPIDERVAGALDRRTSEAIARGAVWVVFDCSALPYLSTYGLTVLLRLRRRLRSEIGVDSAGIALAAASAQVAAMIRAGGLETVIPVHESPEAAVGRPSRGTPGS